MDTRAPLTSANLLLSAIQPDDQVLLAPHLEAVDLPLRQSIEEPNKPIPYVYFPEQGIISVVAKKLDKQIEVGVIGREGMTGSAVVLGTDRTPNHTFVQVAGSGRRVPVPELRSAVEKSNTLRRLLLGYVQTFIAHISETALANGLATVETRAARWLLLAHDRLATNNLPLTHEFLAMMLGTNRPGVTLTIQALEHRGLVANRRGHIVIQDRQGLETMAKGIYGEAEAQLKRLLEAK
jgi:CRP-like cAMP-binding protein